MPSHEVSIDFRGYPYVLGIKPVGPETREGDSTANRWVQLYAVDDAGILLGYVQRVRERERPWAESKVTRTWWEYDGQVFDTRTEAAQAIHDAVNERALPVEESHCTSTSRLVDGRPVEVVVGSSGSVVMRVYPDRAALLEGKQPEHTVVTDVSAILREFSD